jgi:hypothetical protein
MKLFRYIPVPVLLLAIPGLAQTGFPFQNEVLRYTVNWPSGLSLGDAELRATHSPDQWDFEMSLDVAVPGFAIGDHFRSKASGDLCSREFERTTSHGSKKAGEKTAFDYSQAIARRETKGGGKSEFSIPSCARDALDYLYYARRELGQGRVPPTQDLYFGSAYSAHMEYAGPQQLPSQADPADRIVVHLKGPSSDSSFEMLFARDPARTPLVVKIPSALGTVSLELAR